MVNTKSKSRKPNPMKVLIADDHWVVRESLKQVTKQLSQNFEPIEASNFTEAMEILDQDSSIGLMLIDLIMPGFHEFDGLKLLRKKYPAIPVVVISVHEDPEHVLTAISHGVIGYIPKSSNAEEIIRCLTRVISGEVSFPRDIIERSMQQNSNISTESGIPNSSNHLDDLTSRERGVLALIGEGMPVSKVALNLAISPQTVRVHLGNAMKKLNLKNREEAILFAANNVQLLASGE